MASYGMSKPYIARLIDEEKRRYGSAFKCGDAVSTTITANYVTGKLYGDNRAVVERTRLKDAAVTLGVSKLPIVAEEVMFGHEVVDEIIKSNANDKGKYCGYGFISKEAEGSEDIYVACVLYKVLFIESAYGATTDGENIELKGKDLTGTAYTLPDGSWKDVKKFNTEDEADNWIAGILGLRESVEKPVPSVEGGEYTAAQTVKLSCGTTGATVKYTTDGTTPTEKNGAVATASTSISISANTGLKFFAYKEGCNASQIVTEEYFITTI